MKKISLLLMSAAVLVLNSCKKDEPKDPIIPNEEEVITSLILTLTNQDNPADILVYNYLDVDGDGPEDGSYTYTGDLSANSSYDVAVTLLNTLENPPENITLEVEEEKDEHQFFYTPSAASGVTVAYDDLDNNNKPVGLSIVLTTTDASADGTLKVVLIHEPNKTADGVEDGNATNAGGSTDVEVTFALNVVNADVIAAN